GKGDKVHAMLEPGEVVMSNRAVRQYGRGNLVRMNKYAGGGAAKLVNSTIKNKSGEEIGLRKDKYTYKPETEKIVLSNIDRYAGTVIANGTPVEFKKTKQPKGARGIGYEQFEEIIENLGYQRQNEGEQKNYPIDFTKGKKLFDAKNVMTEVGEQSMARKSMLYVLDQSGIDFNYNSPKGIYKTKKGKDLTLKGTRGSKLSTGVDDINLPTVTQLLVKYKVAGSASDKQKIQEKMQHIKKGSRRYKALQQDLTGLQSGEVGLAGAMAILPSQQRLAERNTDYKKRNIGGKIQSFMAGSTGGVKAKAEPFGTGATKFPRRIINAYAKQMEKEETSRRFDKLIQRSPINERIMVDEAMEQQIAQGMQQPLDREQFVASF
ncbi:MAG: hypothetical protein VKK63_12150, partial [Synechococcus sp.]|nr:hypothetical protein [Synechococcus sp.]